MSSFQVVIIVLTVLGLLGGIITVYVKTQVDIAKINVSITFFQKDLDRKEFAICNFEKENKREHEQISRKIDLLIEKINEK
jgi:hypothetical protein